MVIINLLFIDQTMLDEDDVKVAADAMKELEMFMPSVKTTDSKSSKQRCDSCCSLEKFNMNKNGLSC